MKTTLFFSLAVLAACFSTALGGTPKSTPASAVPEGQFLVEYLDDSDQTHRVISKTFSHTEAGPLRCIEGPLSLDKIKHLSFPDPISMETIKQWPARFETAEIPTVRILFEDEKGQQHIYHMWATLWLYFTDTKTNKRIGFHPCRILNVHHNIL